MPPYQLSAWNLQEIKPRSIAKECKRLEQEVKKFEQKRRFLSNAISVKTFFTLVRELEQLHRQMEKVGVYVQLRFAEDSTNQWAVAEMSQVENFLTKMNNKLLFFTFWFKELPEQKAKQLIRTSGKYHYFLETLRRTKKYSLLENEEKIINIKDNTGINALHNIYDIFTSEFEFSFQGKKKTKEEMITFVRSTSAKIREQAYQILLHPYQKNKNILGEIYKMIVTDWQEEYLSLRCYTTSIEVRNIINDLPNKAVETLLKECEKNQPLFQEFVEIKRQKMNLKKFRRFDLYAPLKTEDKWIPYHQAVALVLESFNEFSPSFHHPASLILSKNHVHSLVQKGKRSGAFCSPVTTKIHPYVLLSYTGKYRDVTTLAHELGHGVHMTLAQKQSEFTMDACLPLAETASIFAEMLLSEKIMKDNPQIAKEMMFMKIDDLYASIIRQASFVQFEIKAHQMFKEGKTLDEISQSYLQDLRKQLGPKIEVDKIFAYEWLCIPHIYHAPFYCYAYAFGNLLTLALYELYEEKGKNFVPKIIELLSTGGSESPQKITKRIGVDITSEKFWQKGFDVIKRMIDEVY